MRREADAPVPDLSDELADLEALCQNVIREQFGDADVLQSAPRDPQGWFELLRRLPRNPKIAATFGRIVAEGTASGRFEPGGVERFAALQGYLAALPLLPSLPVHESITRQFCATCRQIAMQSRSFGGFFDYRSDAYEELARIVALRRFHAGQVSFDLMRMPRTWFLKVHPFALPGFAREVLFGVGGIGLIVMPHLNYWRSNPLLMLEKENERAFWRIAKTMEMRPDIRGIIASSWLYSIDVSEVSPHLGWVRRFYEENGAYLVDTSLAAPDAGFKKGSSVRQRLHEAGQFRPRETVVVWQRAEILDWMRRYETGGRSKTRIVSTEAPQATARRLPYWRFDANKTLASGQLTVLNCEPLITNEPRRYVFLVFVLPLLAALLLLALTSGLATALGGTALLVPIIWLIQYFFLQ